MMVRSIFWELLSIKTWAEITALAALIFVTWIIFS